MKFLFIGGTKFVGRQMVEDALRSGHEVHIFQRGQSGSDLFPRVKRYIAERVNIEKIIPGSEKFDVVIDTCGYHPESVKISAEFLKDKTRLYIFISSASVYADFSKIGLNEMSDVGILSVIPDINCKITAENYGSLKFLCEQQVLNIFGVERSLILRPTIIIGPHDGTQRFDYWIKSILTSDKILVPNAPEARIQFIDVRALSQFAIKALERNIFGVYNVIGPRKETKFLDFLNIAKNILNPKVQFEYYDGGADREFPMYVSDSNWKGFFQIDGTKAYDAGLEDISIESSILSVGRASEIFN